MISLFYLVAILLFVVFGVYAERKIAAYIQDRLGPQVTGYKGLLQTIADLTKLLQKEDIVPYLADRRIFLAAPFLLFVFVFLLFSVLPLSPEWFGARFSSSLFFLTAFISLDVLALTAAGWSSNNKFALLGAVRAAAQMVSYEAPLAFSVLSVAILAGSLDLVEIVMQQKDFVGHLLWENLQKSGGILCWNVLKYPVLLPVFLIFFLTTLAQANRAPFDVPEAESEIIAGFMTEYSGFRWAIFMLSEYALMLFAAYWGSLLFLGGWLSPLPNMALIDANSSFGAFIVSVEGLFWLHFKVFLIIFVQMWIRWTFPRMRIDQLMTFCWKVLLPASILLFLASALWKILLS